MRLESIWLGEVEGRPVQPWGSPGANPEMQGEKCKGEKAEAYFVEIIKIICLSAISKWMCPKHYVPFPLESICCLLPLACSTGGKSIYSPIMRAPYYLTIKSARCCDEISKINICSDERYISTRSNSFCTFNIFWLRPPVRNTNLRGV